jgi:hypothetical protein
MIIGPGIESYDECSARGEIMAENRHEEKKRRPYSKPVIEKVALSSDEVSFAGCKNSNTGVTLVKNINYQCQNSSCKVISVS